jgi:hypothetical protein
MKSVKLFFLSLFVALLVSGLHVNTAAAAICTWTGAIDVNWNNSGNWSCAAVPGSDDEVVLDNSELAGSYSITLPTGATTTTIRKLTITPNGGNNITLILPSTNTGNPGLLVGDSTAGTDDITLNEGAILVNSSGAGAGSGIAFQTAANGTFRINNGGRYVHNTTRANTALVSQLSTAAGTENGVFEFDVSGTGSYAISASGRTFGSLVLTRTAGPAIYTASGGSALTIRGNFTINSGVTFNNSMTGANNIAGNWTNHGVFSGASTNIFFNGVAEQVIGGSQPTSFNNLTVNNGAILTIPANTAATLLTNNGRIQQSQDVIGASPVGFLNLGGYGGVTIANTGSDDLGFTTVIIRGNQACTTTNSTVRRCFDITPTPTGLDIEATITFYYAEAERNGLNCNNMYAWRWNAGLSAWELAGAGGDLYQCATEPYSLVVEWVTEFSPFVLFDNPESAPTAVTLRGIQANSVNLLFVLLALIPLIAGTGFVIWRRRLA